MKNKTIQNEIHAVAINHILPDHVVEDIVESVFKMARKAIESADRENNIFENIQLSNFGKFYVTEGKLAYLKIFNEQRKNDSKD